LAQYLAGTVSVTNGSAVVAGTSTAWLSNISIGDIFIVANDAVWYEVASVNADGSITLSANYAGVTASSQLYAITRDFTPNLNLPYPSTGDIETSSIVRRAMLTLDNGVVVTSMTHRGAWVVGTTYAVGDAIGHAGRYFVSLVANNTGHTPPASPAISDAFWSLVSDAGTAGSVIHSGTGAPASSLGVDTDLYIDTASASYNMYGPKATGSWGSPVALRDGTSAANALAAATSATNAGISETNAGVSATNAGISETNAGVSATNAGISETNAGNSAVASSDSAAASAAASASVATIASGTATSGSATGISDTAANFGVNTFMGANVTILRSGLTVRTAIIASHTNTALVLASGPAAQVGDTYKIFSMGRGTFSVRNAVGSLIRTSANVIRNALGNLVTVS